MLKEVGPNHAWRDYLPKNQEIFLILGQKLVSYLGVDWKSFPDNLTDYIIKLPWNDAKFHLCSLLRAYPTKAAINQLRDVLMSDSKNVKKLRDYSLSEFKKYSKVRTTHRQEQTVCK